MATSNDTTNETTVGQTADQTNIEEEAARAEAHREAMRKRRNLNYYNVRESMLCQLGNVYENIFFLVEGFERGWATTEELLVGPRETIVDHDLTYDLPPRTMPFTNKDQWRAAGKQLGQPAPVAKASKVYLDNQDPLSEWLDACFEKTEDGSITKRLVELPLKTWYWSFLTQAGKAESNALYQRFGDMLISKGFVKRLAYDGKRFTGPALTVEAQRVAESAAFDADWRRTRKDG